MNVYFKVWYIDIYNWKGKKLYYNVSCEIFRGIGYVRYDSGGVVKFDVGYNFSVSILLRL